MISKLVNCNIFSQAFCFGCSNTWYNADYVHVVISLFSISISLQCISLHKSNETVIIWQTHQGQQRNFVFILVKPCNFLNRKTCIVSYDYSWELLLIEFVSECILQMTVSDWHNFCKLKSILVISSEAVPGLS